MNPKKNILIVIWHRRARASLTQNCVARLQGKSHQEHHHHLAATGQYYWSKCLSLRRHPATGLLQMYPEARAMDDPYDIHSRGFFDHSAVIAEVALSRKSIGTLIIPEWHVLRTLATAAGVLELCCGLLLDARLRSWSRSGSGVHLRWSALER